MDYIKVILIHVFLFAFSFGKAHKCQLPFATKIYSKCVVGTSTNSEAIKNLLKFNTGKISKIKRKRKPRSIECGFQIHCFGIKKQFAYPNYLKTKTSTDILIYLYNSNCQRGPPSLNK